MIVQIDFNNIFVLGGFFILLICFTTMLLFIIWTCCLKEFIKNKLLKLGKWQQCFMDFFEMIGLAKIGGKKDKLRLTNLNIMD